MEKAAASLAALALLLLIPLYVVSFREMASPQPGNPVCSVHCIPDPQPGHPAIPGGGS